MEKLIDLNKFRKYGYDKEIEAYDYNIKTINLSSIITKLIQIAGQYVEMYASDIIYSIDEIKNKINNNDIVNGEIMLFGFRESGVDHNAFIERQDPNTVNLYYRQVWRLDFKVSDDKKIKLTLYRVYYN